MQEIHNTVLKWHTILQSDAIQSSNTTAVHSYSVNQWPISGLLLLWYDINNLSKILTSKSSLSSLAYKQQMTMLGII